MNGTQMKLTQFFVPKNGAKLSSPSELETPPSVTANTIETTKSVKTACTDVRKTPKSVKTAKKTASAIAHKIPGKKSGGKCVKVNTIDKAFKPSKRGISSGIKRTLTYDDDHDVAKKKQKLTERNVLTKIDNVDVTVKKDAEKEETDEFDFSNFVFDEVEIAKETVLNLSTFKYCRVDFVSVEKRQTILHLSGCGQQAHLKVNCYVHGYTWPAFSYEPGEMISIMAKYSNLRQKWIIDDECGCIVKNPDVLVSGTTLVGTLFCMRKSVLAHLFPGCDPPNFIMMMGSLIHDLFQEVLKKELWAPQDLRITIEKILSDKKTFQVCYECDVPLSQVRKELESFVPRIVNFSRSYMKNAIKNPDAERPRLIEDKVEEILDMDKIGKELPLPETPKTWPGDITEVKDIEENFWMPHLGLKGKVDVTVNARHEGKTKTMPLELKTGRASNSVEHRGQILLYTMMMAEASMKVESGLLLYLREDDMSEITLKRNQAMGLLSTRNEYLDYLGKNERNFAALTRPVLPKPIQRATACKKCPYLTLCCASMTKEEVNAMDSKNMLKTWANCETSHLEPQHISFVFDWAKLLRMETKEIEATRGHVKISDIWHKTPLERQKRGSCISLLRADRDVVEDGRRYVHRLRKESGNNFPSGLEISVGDYIVVSCGQRYAVATGTVREMDECSILLALDRNLHKFQKGASFIVDRYSSPDSLLAVNLSNLGRFLEESCRAAELRAAIVDKKSPEFGREEYGGKTAFVSLNACQRAAVSKALNARTYALIKGMPGTGKTATIAALTEYLSDCGSSVLITSHTHSAVDNILMRLQEGRRGVLRLGPKGRVHAKVKGWCEEESMAKEKVLCVQDLERFYNSKLVIGVTCMGSSHPMLQKRVFDYCIVDEATQVLQPSVYGALFSCKKFILVGDPDQLPPVVHSKEAGESGLSESLFERLDKPEVTAVLSHQYRMNGPIMDLANAFSYNGLLKCDSEDVARAVVPTMMMMESMERALKLHPWLKLPISSDLNHSVAFLNVSALPVPNPDLEYENETEASVVFTIIRCFIEGGLGEESIGVIAPYRDQVELMRKMARDKNYDTVEINTVDQYQGRDKEIIVYSCTKFARKDNKESAGILGDKRRLTVAITRAKKKLIMVGNEDVLKEISVFRELFRLIPRDNFADIVERSF